MPIQVVSLTISIILLILISIGVLCEIPSFGITVVKITSMPVVLYSDRIEKITN